MSTHTPGPWIVSHANNKEESSLGIHGQGGDGYIIADLCSDGYDSQTQHANARMMAAAPELLEALRPFANYACDEPCDCHNCRARAAIVKATV